MTHHLGAVLLVLTFSGTAVAQVGGAAAAAPSTTGLTSLFKVGIGAGHRIFFPSTGQIVSDASINPKDHTLQVDGRDWADFVIASVLIADPFSAYTESYDAHKRWIAWALSHIAFVAKLDLLQIDSGGVGAGKSVEGGIGLAYRLHTNLYFAATLDRVSGRSLRNGIVAGTVYTDKNGDPLTTISKSDDTYFVNDSFLALWLGLSFVR